MCRRVAAAVLLASFAAIPLFAADLYRFHIKVTDGETALRAHPALAELHLTEEQIARAADDRVVLLDRTEGLDWGWLTMSWLYDGPPPEFALDEHGSARSASDADFSVTPIDYRKFRVRCGRELCRFGTTSPDGREVTTELRRGETAELRFDSDVDVGFPAAH